MGVGEEKPTRSGGFGIEMLHIPDTDRKFKTPTENVNAITDYHTEVLIEVDAHLKN